MSPHTCPLPFHPTTVLLGPTLDAARTSDRLAMSSISGDSDMEELCEDELCWLCEKPGCLPCCYGGCKFHRPCHNAVLARHRQVRLAAGESKDSRKALDAEKRTMRDRAAKWRPKVLPFLDGDAKQKRDARANTRNEVQSRTSTVKSSGTMEFEDDHLLTKMAYRKYRQDESDIDDEACDDAFEDLCVAQKHKYTHANGKPRVRVPNLCGKVRKYSGAAETEGITETRGLDDVEANLLRGQLAKKTRGMVAAPVARANRRADGGYRSPSTPPIPRSRSPRARARAREPSRAGSSASGLSRGGSEVGESEASTLPCPSRRGSGAKKAAANTGAKQPGAGAAFAVRKDKLTIAIDNSLSSLTGDKCSSLDNLLSKACAQLLARHGDESDCPHSSEALTAEIADLGERGSLLKDQAQKCKAANIDQLEQTLEALQKDVASLSERVKAQCEGMEYRTACKITERRSAYQKSYWQHTKITQHLVDGGMASGDGKGSSIIYFTEPGSHGGGWVCALPALRQTGSRRGVEGVPIRQMWLLVARIAWCARAPRPNAAQRRRFKSDRCSRE